MMRSNLPRFVSLLTILWAWLLVLLPYESIAGQEEQASGRRMARQATQAREIWITADHSKYEVLQQEFRSGSEVTRACLSCHSEAASQFRNTIHWTWIDPQSDEVTLVGKAGHSVNNCCISIKDCYITRLTIFIFYYGCLC